MSVPAYCRYRHFAGTVTLPVDKCQCRHIAGTVTLPVDKCQCRHIAGAGMFADTATLPVPSLCRWINVSADILSVPAYCRYRHFAGTVTLPVDKRQCRHIVGASMLAGTATLPVYKCQYRHIAGTATLPVCRYVLNNSLGRYRLYNASSPPLPGGRGGNEGRVSPLSIIPHTASVCII